MTAGAVFAETQWVKTDTVNILGGKGSIYPVLGTVKKGAELNVISRDGKWLQVQVVGGGPQGWVFEGSLSPQKVNGDLKLGTIGNTADQSTSAASRGLQPSAEQYVSSKGLNKVPLERLIALRNSIPPVEWETFTLQGKVGPAKP